MSFDWQNVAALAVVFAAAAYLARRAWRQFIARRPITGCSRCSACPSSGTRDRQLVPLTYRERKAI